MKPAHGRLVAMTQGPLTFEGIITASETREKARRIEFACRLNLSTVRIDPGKLPDGVNREAVVGILRALYPGLIITIGPEQ